MAKLLDVLAEKISSGPERAAPESRFTDLAESAPASLKPLLEALASREPRLELGWRVFDREPESFADVFETFHIDEAYDGWFDPEASLLLGRWPGGEVFFGAFWDKKKVQFAEVDPENHLIRRFATPEKWFERVLADEIERADHADDESDRERPPDLVELAKALKKKLPRLPKGDKPEKPAKPKKGQLRLVLASLDRANPAEPVARAYPRYKFLTFSDASPKGNRLAGHDFQDGFAAEIGILDAAGKRRPLPAEKWDEYMGMALVPGTERVLCTKDSAGNLLEIDLESGKVTDRGLEKVCAPCFIDSEHISLLRVGEDEGELQAHRYEPTGKLGPPVATLKVSAANRHFAANGYAFLWTRDKKDKWDWSAYRFDGKSFVELGRVSSDKKGLVLLVSHVEADRTYIFAHHGGYAAQAWFEVVV